MNKQILVMDASQMAEFLKCSESWRLKYSEFLNLPPTQDNALNKGTVIHSLMDLYYTQKTLLPGTYDVHTKNVIDIYIKSEGWKELVTEAELEFLCTRFIHYAAYYANSDFNVASRGSRVGVELGFSKILKETETHIYIVEGRVDLLTYYGPENEICIVDHKTQSRTSNLYSYTPQFLTYAWAAGVRYAVINYFGLMQTGKAFDWFRRQPIRFTDYILSEWEKTMLSIFDRRAKNDIRKEMGNCSGAFQSSPCMFTRVCEIESPELREAVKQSNFVKADKIWRPW